MSLSNDEVKIEIHGNNLTLRGDSLRTPVPARAPETLLSALSLSTENDEGLTAAAAAVTGAAQPLQGQPPSEEQRSGDSQYVLLTLSEPSPATHQAVQATGATVMRQVADGVYLYRHDGVNEAADLENIAGVRYIDAYPASVKVDARLRASIDAREPPGTRRANTARAVAAASASVPVEIHFHNDVPQDRVRDVVASFCSSGCLQEDSVQQFDSMAVATAALSRVDEMAAAPEVYVIQHQADFDDANVFATDILAVTGPVLLASGYQAAPAPDVLPGDPALPFDGTGETISIGDSGFDRGTSANMADLTGLHPAFAIRTDGVSFFCMDKAHDPALGRNLPVAAACITDIKGHGTHVCASAVGSSRAQSVSGIGCVGYIRGSAPGARLLYTSMMQHNTDLTKRRRFDGPMTATYAKTVDAVTPGAHPPIFSESWGLIWKNGQGEKPGYDINTENLDTLLQSDDTLVCFAAGNDGDATGYKGVCALYSAGKNVLTVGACESSTSHWTQPYADVTSNAALDPQLRPAPGNPITVASFSCSGTRENDRQKPDVVAPGVDVLSALARAAPVPEPNKAALDPSYCFKDGTSMATPLVAGCAAVLSQALRASDEASPGAYPAASGTLLKALLINGAVTIDSDSDHQIVTGTVRRSGFGRVNVLCSLRHLRRPPGNGSSSNVRRDDDRTTTAGYAHGKLGLHGGDTWPLEVADPQPTPGSLVDDTTRQSVKVTLCWADRGNAALQARFYLTLTEVATGRVRFGNRCGWVAAADATDPVKRLALADTVNNVQQIFCTDVAPGKYTVAVQYFDDKSGRVPAPVVPYAVAWLVF